MHRSIPSLTIPPSDPREFAHSNCPGVGFLLLSCPGVCPGEVLNQSKSSIILKQKRDFRCLLNKWVGAPFICSYMPVKWAVWRRPHLRYNKYIGYQNFFQVNWISSWSKFHRIYDVYMANMPQKTKLYSRFLLLKVYPDSPVHTRANTEPIQFCPVMLKFTR